jgi:hypothetical protein
MWQVEWRKFEPHAQFSAAAAASQDECEVPYDTAFIDNEFCTVRTEEEPDVPIAVAVPTREVNAGSKLWVVCAYFNPCNYENRRTNYGIFADHLRNQGVPLCTVEMATSESTLRLRDMADRYGIYAPVISGDVLWAKEALINIGAGKLPPTCTVVVWADADLVWEQDDWADKTVRELERHNGPVVVQPFERGSKMRQHERYETHYANRTGEIPSVTPIGKAYVTRPDTYVITADIYKLHAGYAWAMRRDVFNKIGGLYVYCICGQADFVMAIAFSHDPQRDGAMPLQWNPHATFSWGYGLQNHARNWQTAVSQIVRGRLGYVKDVHIFHNWHGDEHDRQYESRGRALVNYEPGVDVVRLPSGIMAWSPSGRAKKLPEALKAYFENRKEDGRPAHEVAEREAQLARARAGRRRVF